MRLKSLDWYGERILEQIKDRIPSAIDETTDEAVNTAQSMRHMSSRASAGLESRPAVDEGGRWVGRWGVFSGDLWWELFIEVGNPYYAGDNAKRTASDMAYPNLAGRIARG